MVGLDRIQKRFEELSSIAAEIEQSKGWVELPMDDSDPNWETETPKPATYRSFELDRNLMLQWATSVRSLLERLFGENASTTTLFSEHTVGVSGFSPATFDSAFAVFNSARTDFEGGYLFDVRSLVQADVFSDELEQAKHFLTQGYKVPAAVIAGTVLETTLRELCDRHPDLEPAKADKMIGDLAKQGEFNKMRADQLRAWMKTRNSAAHGKPDEFNEGDVTRMIDGIRDFVANHMS